MYELPEKDISNVVVQCRQYSKISCRGLCMNYLKKISQTCWSSVGSITISCRGLYLNYLKEISQTWWFSVRSIYDKLSWFVNELPENIS